MTNGRVTGEEPEEKAAGKATGESAESVNSAAAWSKGEEAGGFTFEEQDVTPDLDPQLQHVLISARAGRVDPTLVEEAEDGSLRVDVTAVLRNPTQPVPGLQVAHTVTDVVTGSCAVEDIEAVRQHPNVVSLKGATKVAPDVRFSVPEIRASREMLREALPQGAALPDGAGVIVGVVDYGCDYVHENFRRQDGTTRLLFLWDQNGPRNETSPEGYTYGREFTSRQIDDALRSGDPYAALAYRPEPGSHGTHVMDIAAGNGRGTGSPGVAPTADLIFVELDSRDFRPEESFGNSRRLQEAVKYIFDRAAQLGRPCVVNLSLGTHGGPHDGSTPVERWFDGLLETPGRAIVISAGNSFQRRSHAAGRIMPGQSRTLGWEKSASDATNNELEVWYNGDAELEVTLIFPSGQRFGPRALGAKPIAIRDSAGRDAGQIIHRAKDSLNGDNLINIFLGPGMPSGVWGIELRAVGARPVDFHAWIERDAPGHQSQFVAADDDSSHTVGSISCGKNTIVVGSYQPKPTGRDLSAFTSEGPTRDGRQKPEVSAPGDGILAANALSRNGAVRMSGTSMAAPHVTGLVALVMQAAGRPLSATEIRQAVIGAARRNPPPAGVWNPRYGNGRVDCAAAVLSQLPRVLEVEPVQAQAQQLSPAAEGDGVWQPVGKFFGALLDHAQSSAVRMKVEVEVEYVNK
jgi:subtilisin family serine protease